MDRLHNIRLLRLMMSQSRLISTMEMQLGWKNVAHRRFGSGLGRIELKQRMRRGIVAGFTSVCPAQLGQP
jgi:hypothetical protein